MQRMIEHAVTAPVRHLRKLGCTARFAGTPGPCPLLSVYAKLDFEKTKPCHVRHTSAPRRHGNTPGTGNGDPHAQHPATVELTRPTAMDLLEHQGKALFAKYGIAVPDHELVRSPNEAAAAARRLGPACMVKAQVRHGGRGKLGLVRKAGDPLECMRIAADLLGATTANYPEPVDLLLIERALDKTGELYLAIAIDDVRGQPVLMASTAGGIDIEGEGERIVTLPIDVESGLANWQAVVLWRRAGLAGPALQAAATLTLALWRLFRDEDALLAEINPVLVDSAGRLWAGDAKVSIDDSALYRQPESAALASIPSGTDIERRARLLDVNTYMDLEGDISLITSGASLGMLVLDQVARAGGRPANFMDMGGQATPLAREKLIQLALYKARTDPRIRAIAMVFVATSKPVALVLGAIRNALAAEPPVVPIHAFMLMGSVATAEQSLESARAELAAMGIHSYTRLDTAIAAAVAAAANAETPRRIGAEA